MKARLEVSTQEEFDAAADRGDIIIVNSGFFVARGSSSAVARGSSSVVARGSSRVEAWGSSRVEAWGSSSVVARGSSSVVASPLVHTHVYSDEARVKGGKQTRVSIGNSRDWAEYYGCEITRSGWVTVFKAVRDDLRSAHGALYEAGTTVIANDWDGGVRECGGGLHFSPHPKMAKSFDPKATRFLLCKVKLQEMRDPENGDHSPEKCKAKRCRVICEVDEWGDKISKSE